MDLTLDSAIRDWILLPITLVILLVGLLRHNAIMLMNAPPKRTEVLDLRQQRLMARSGTLRTNHDNIPPAAFLAKRTQLLTDLSSGRFLKEKPKPEPKETDEPEMPANPLGDPGAMDGMMDQMKKSMVMMIPQQLIMGWISFFFSGFVVAKVPIELPFPLDYFKGWLQRGLLSDGLEIGWVSSISWYFLVAFFGLNAVYRILLGDDNAADSTRDMMGPLGAMGGASPAQSQPNPMAGKMDFAKLHKTEHDTLDRVSQELIDAPPPIKDIELTPATQKGSAAKARLTGFGGKKGEKGGKRWAGDGIEERVLKKYGKIFV